ncbi:hypothetical protein ABPG75_003809 [Micractinium tetrahymenae]
MDAQQDLKDWAGLPPGLLRCICAAVQAPPPPAAFLPLMPAARQWLALRLSCRAWATALGNVHLAVDCCVPVPWVLPWLYANAGALCLAPPPLALSMPDCTARQAREWVQDRCGRLPLDGDGSPWESIWRRRGWQPEQHARSMWPSQAVHRVHRAQPRAGPRLPLPVLPLCAGGHAVAV